MRTISEHSQAQTANEPTLWAKVFHSVPHVNITFHSVNSQFNIENELYLESLGILVRATKLKKNLDSGLFLQKIWIPDSFFKKID